MTGVTPAAPAPDPADWRVAAWRSFLRAHATVIRDLERDLDNDAAMPLAWYDVLLTLAQAPERKLRMAQLADRVLLSRSGLTRLVDRLEREELVRRERSSDDARGTYTVLTSAGLRRLKAAVPAHLASVQRHWLAHFDDAELRTLAQLMARIDADG
ncbi:MAG TPA: MarR family winged helix-turn-helix transcriptional regulator [Jatrophihabitantaceae bacterium]|jgi:DNA-binding MarR family transcriptional regulator|nr:MarR family winged helix-turn-helix transcriptional regulator [Jatrophihabitantaceae bacterium]